MTLRNNKTLPLRLLLCCLAAAAVCACARRPEGVLTNRQMVDVLYDLHTAEGVLQISGYNYAHDAEVKAYYGVILAKHGITQAQFDSSLVWYIDHPQYFQRVYPKVMKRLQERHDVETAMLSARDEELKQALADSLAAVREEKAQRFNFLKSRLPEGTRITYDGTIFLPAEAVTRQYIHGVEQSLYVSPEPVPLCTDTLQCLLNGAQDTLQTTQSAIL